jgi:sterol desaturase/sphingolipid hydroxylase (fatty acid hydroxylase superfamily)
MKLEDLLAMAIFGTFALMMLLEALVPARPYPTKKLWRLRGFLFLLGMAVIATFTPLALPVEWLAAHRVLDLSGLGIVAGTIVGYAAVSLASYAWHRAAHRFGFLWRTFHQMHHAPQRMDMGGAAVFHPLEVVVFIALSTVTTTLVLGLSPEAAAVTGVRRRTSCITRAKSTRTTMATCRCGISSSAPSKTPLRTALATWASTPPRTDATARCSPSAR